MKKKRITIYSNDYWINKGFTEEAIQKVIQSKKETSCFNKEFWIKKGFYEKEALIKVKEKKNSMSINSLDIEKKKKEDIL